MHTMLSQWSSREVNRGSDPFTQVYTWSSGLGQAQAGRGHEAAQMRTGGGQGPLQYCKGLGQSL